MAGSSGTVSHCAWQIWSDFLSKKSQADNAVSVMENLLRQKQLESLVRAGTKRERETRRRKKNKEKMKRKRNYKRKSRKKESLKRTFRDGGRKIMKIKTNKYREKTKRKIWK